MTEILVQFPVSGCYSTFFFFFLTINCCYLLNSSSHKTTTSSRESVASWISVFLPPFLKISRTFFSPGGRNDFHSSCASRSKVPQGLLKTLKGHSGTGNRSLHLLLYWTQCAVSFIYLTGIISAVRFMNTRTIPHVFQCIQIRIRSKKNNNNNQEIPRQNFIPAWNVLNKYHLWYK